MKHYRFSHLCLVLSMLVIFAGFLNACGIKGLPVPPRRYRPPAVTDLTYKIEGETLRLTWNVPSGTEQEKVNPTGCAVYRSVRPVSDADCKNCPAPYKKVADVPVQRGGSDGKPAGKLHYSEPLVGGFDYAFKVTCYTDNEIFGEDSNIVNFKY